MKTYQVDENGYYGEFGGAYVPEILHQCVENLQKKYLEVLESDSFKKEFNQLLRLCRPPFSSLSSKKAE